MSVWEGEDVCGCVCVVYCTRCDSTRSHLITCSDWHINQVITISIYVLHLYLRASSFVLQAILTHILIDHCESLQHLHFMLKKFFLYTNPFFFFASFSSFHLFLPLSFLLFIGFIVRTCT